jgi:four helix bundle protein
LKDQIRRASVSVLSNIAEGFERGGDKEFLQFLALAKGSCGEVRAQLYVALDQGYVSADVFERLSKKATEVSQLISGLMKYLKGSALRGNKYT